MRGLIVGKKKKNLRERNSYYYVGYYERLLFLAAMMGGSVYASAGFLFFRVSIAVKQQRMGERERGTAS